MSDYYYSQNYGLYKNYGISLPTMGGKGCLIVCLSMLLSYFNRSAYYPEQMLSWGRQEGMLDERGNTRFNVFCKAAGNKLRIDNPSNARPGESVYTVREINMTNGLQHWVLDHPNLVSKIIDPIDGRVKDYEYYLNQGHGKYSGRSVSYIGKQ